MSEIVNAVKKDAAAVEALVIIKSKGLWKKITGGVVVVGIAIGAFFSPWCGPVNTDPDAGVSAAIVSVDAGVAPKTVDDFIEVDPACVPDLGVPANVEPAQLIVAATVGDQLSIKVGQK